MCAAIAAEIFTICTNATVPSCIRVPPETGAASSGSRSAVARSTARVSRSAESTPIEPARKPNSHATTATRRPRIRPSPDTTDSSSPVRSVAAASSAAYSSEIGPRTGGVSHDRNDPSSSTRSMRSVADSRSVMPSMMSAAPDLPRWGSP